ncbi:MAG: DUF881 domain-containing protein [Chloroflexota bacterium]
MRRSSSQIAIAAVAFVLGLLVVVQLRAQSGGSGLAELSAQDLTILVANVNTRNDQLRTEIATLERELSTLTANSDRGASSVDQVRADLARIEAYAGLSPVTGPGVSISVAGAIDGPGVEELINDLRNAGSEAIGVDGIRLVAGSVVSGTGGNLSVDGHVLPDPFEISAIGASDALTGSLTRVGGMIAQLAATYPDAHLTVTPVERLDLPRTNRTLVPGHGRPRL